MIRLHAGEMPTDKALTIHVKVDRNPLHSNSDEIWMTDEEWFAPVQDYSRIQDETLRKQIDIFMEKWTASAMTHKEDQDEWPVKSAAVEFYLPEGRFEIRPADLNNDIDSYMFECVSNDIEQDLYDAGAVYVQYTGMID